MKYNWNPTRVAFLDFETQSEANLDTAPKYAKHPSTRALTCVVKTDDGQIHRMGPYLGAADKEKLCRIASEHTVVAHNAPFDSAIWEHTLGLPEVEWFDTLAPARAGGLPGKLDDLGVLLTGQGKDKKGKMLIDMLCIVRGGKVPAVGPAHGLLMAYNVRDVELLEAVYHRVKQYGEPAVMTVDHTINNRGIPICKEFLEALQHVYAVNKESAEAEFLEKTGGVNPGSSKAVKEWVQAQGFNIPGVNKAVLRDLVADPERFAGSNFDDGTEMASTLDAVQAMLELRREVVGVGAGKIKAALDCIEPDGRIRDQFVYYGAGPGRWSGRALQPHNMPLAVQGLDSRCIEPTVEAIGAAARESTERLKFHVPSMAVANSMLRHAVRCDNLLVADYNAVELRCVAWLCEEPRMLPILSDPKAPSIYLDMGRHVFGRQITKDDVREYAVAKSIVLGCGYGMSGPKFQYTLQVRSKISAESLKSLTGGLSAVDAVAMFRSRYPFIPLMWKEMHRATHDAVKGIPTSCCKCHFHMVGADLHIVLPSGRPIVYRNARIEPRVPGYVKLYNMESFAVDTVIYDSPRFRDNFLYGSKVCENISQGTCRDLLANALVNLDAAGFNLCFHVHDESGCQDPSDRFHEYMEIKSTPPVWAKGFPLMVEGYSGPLWSKNADGYTKANYFCGRKL